MVLYKRNIVVRDDAITAAGHLTTKQSLVPNGLGMPPVLNLEFEELPY